MEDAYADASPWTPRILELCHPEAPEDTLRPGYLTRGVSEVTAPSGYPFMADDIAAAGFAPPHPFRLERLRLRLSGQGSVKVTVWGDYMREQPDLDVVLVPEREILLSGDRWVSVEGFEPVVVEPGQRFWVGVTFSGAPGDCLFGPAQGGWDRFRVPAAMPSGEWASGPHGMAMAVHAEGSFLCLVTRKWFTDRRGEAGLAGNDYNILQLADLDGDGLEEILAIFFEDGSVWVHKNLGGMRFAAPRRLFLPGWFGLVLAADVDNDGDQDVYLGVGELPGEPDQGSRPLLLLNDGQGNLAPRLASGLEIRGDNAAGAFVDFDGDGLLDLYMGNLRHDSQDPGVDSLFRGRGDGSFEEVSVQAGLQSRGPGPTFGVTFCDVSDDGWPDLLVAQYNGEPNRLWLNRQDGTFTEVAALAGIAKDEVGTRGGNTFMLECGDYDNDGHMDILSGEFAMPHEAAEDRTRLLRWSPEGEFGFGYEDVTSAAGLPESRSMVDPAWGDFDNDGHLDFIVSGQGYPTQASQLFRNSGDGTFTDVTYEAGLDIPYGILAAWADLDGDGDLDLVAYSVTRGSLLLYESQLSPGTRWIQLRLVGMPPSNRDALGARVTATTGDLVQHREVSGASGSRINAGSRIVHFGFGSHAEHIQVLVRWPSGRREHFDDLAQNLRHTLVEGTGVGE
jgi:hypothetical protein